MIIEEWFTILGDEYMGYYHDVYFLVINQEMCYSDYIDEYEFITWWYFTYTFSVDTTFQILEGPFLGDIEKELRECSAATIQS